MDKQELFDKAVENLKGVWPPRRNAALLECVCTPEEFELRAKELGWVSGFKWGVEYPTNGKKPDLDGDIIISWKDKFGLGSTCKAGVLNYQFGTGVEVVSFAVTDSRYKPKEPEQQTKPNNSWYDRGELPQVGVECEVSNCGNDFEWCKIKYIGSSLCVVDHRNYNDQHYHLSSVKFRPIQTERELLIDIIISTGNLSEGDLADAILAAGFTNNKGEIN